jgi:catalase (peroxidase I)
MLFLMLIRVVVFLRSNPFHLFVSGNHNSVNAPGGQLMMLPTDLVLLQDKEFLKWVQIYGKDSKKFDADFSKAFQKLEELGTTNLTPTQWA